MDVNYMYDNDIIRMKYINCWANRLWQNNIYSKPS